MTEASATTAAAALAWAGRLHADGPRTLLGITGSPGAGKSTFAEWLVGHFEHAIAVPMDGFHLADAELSRRGSLGRKGAPDTFDSWGYAALLTRLRAATEQEVLAPAFDRTLEQPVAGSICVEPHHRLIVTEGNYLLLDEAGWPTARAQLDAVWHVRVPDPVRRERLVARHTEFGKGLAAAQAWVERVDEPNAKLIEAAAGRADRVVDLTDWQPT